MESCVGEFLVHFLFKGIVLSFNKELKPVLIAFGILQGDHIVPFYEGWNFNFGNTPLDWIQKLLE